MQSEADFLLISWVVVSPFAMAAGIGAVAAARRFLARVHPLALVVGWVGVALLVGGVLVTRSPLWVLVGAPLAGLAVWSRGGGGGGGDDGRGGDDDDDPPPDDAPQVDWDAFERAFRDYARRRPRERDRSPRERDRSPARR
jgi:hypothetical protein